MGREEARQILDKSGWGSAIVPIEYEAAKRLYNVAIEAVIRSYDLGIYDEGMSNAMDAAGADL